MDSDNMMSTTTTTAVVAAAAQFPGISKVVRHGFESGSICPPKWAVMISWTTISDHFGSPIGPLWKLLKNHLALAHEPFSCVRSHCRSDFHYNYVITQPIIMKQVDYFNNHPLGSLSEHGR